MAKEFSHHGPILTCDEGIIVGLAGTEFHDSDEELAEEGGDLPIDILRAIVEMEPLDEERKGGQQLVQAGRSAASLIFSNVQTTSNCVIASTALM